MGRATYIEPSLDEWLKKFHFHTEIKVRYCETDMSGHVNNTSYVVYLEQARAEYFDMLDFFNSEVTAVTADIWCHYHKEAYFPDTLRVGVRVGSLGSKSLNLEYYVLSSDQSLIATASGTLVMMDKKTKKSTAIPVDLRNKINKLEKFA